MLEKGGHSVHYSNVDGDDNGGGDGDVPVFDPDNVNISFNGCGFLGIYHVGVAAALRAYLPNMRFSVVCGASAGALAGVSLLGDVPPDNIALELMEAGSICRKLIGGPINPNFNVCGRLEEALMRLLPEDIHIRANGRLFVSVTSVYSGENIIISNYSSKKELVDSVIASTFIPIFSGIFPCRIRGVPVIDGGFSVNQVVLNEGTVTVSPFAGDAHICPQDDVLDSDMITRLYVAQAGVHMTWENIKRLTQVLYPPKTKVMSDLMMQGFLDTTRFLSEYGVINRPLSCLTVESHMQTQQKSVTEGSLKHEGASLPEALARVVRQFLEGECTADSSDPTGQNQNSSGGDMTLTNRVYSVVKALVYYQPLLILGRLSASAAIYAARALISSLAALLPQLDGDHNKFIKFRVERFLGVLIGYFGPIIGYEYKYVDSSAVRGILRQKKKSNVKVPDIYQHSGMHPNRKRQQTKFNCSVNIHQFNSGDRETANVKRRMSSFQRRKSLSAEAIQKQLSSAGVAPITGSTSGSSKSMPGTPGSQQYPKRRFSVAPGSVDSSGSGIDQSAGRRLSVAPGLEGGIGDHSLLPRSGSEVNIPGVRINLPEGHQSDSSEVYGGRSDEGSSDDAGWESGGEEIVDKVEDDSEILCLQLESLIDTPIGMSMPLNMDEAVRLQSDGLEHAYGSRTTSTRVSRLNTPLNSGRQTPADGKSRRGSANSAALMVGAANALLNNEVSGGAGALPTGDPEQPSETLQNIVGVTRETDAMFKTYYTDENGELVTVSMYNVEDPVSLIGNDVLQATDDYEFRDEDREEDGFPPSGVSDADVAARLEELYRLHGHPPNKVH